MSGAAYGVNRRMRRWEHDDVLEKAEDNLQNTPDAMTVRASTVEHPFGTIKLWTGSRHFLMKTLSNVRTEMSLNVLAYNLRRMISILGVKDLIKAIQSIAGHKIRVSELRFERLKYRIFLNQLIVRVDIALVTKALCPI